MTVRANCTTPLSQANTRRREAALAAARHAIEQLSRDSQAVSFGAVAQTAGVSRAWLYRQPDIRKRIEQLRDNGTAPSTKPASVASLRQRLDNARAEITRLRTENHALRAQLARHLGTQRATPHRPANQHYEHQPAVTAATCLRRANP
jgi:hypothetical protein